MAARAGVEPMTLQLKVIDSTNAPPRLQLLRIMYYVERNEKIRFLLDGCLFVWVPWKGGVY